MASGFSAAQGPYSNASANNAALLYAASNLGVDPSQLTYVPGQGYQPVGQSSGPGFQPSYQSGQMATGGGVNPSPLNPVDYATPQTAQQVAGLVGGQVTPDTAMGTGPGASIGIPTPQGVSVGGQTFDAGVLANLLSRGYSPESAALELNQQSGGAVNVTPQQVAQFIGAPSASSTPNPAGGWYTPQGGYNPATAAAPAGGGTAAPGAPTPGAGGAPMGTGPQASNPGWFQQYENSLNAGGAGGGMAAPGAGAPGSFSPAGGGTAGMAPRSIGGQATNSPMSFTGGGFRPMDVSASGGATAFQLPVGQPPNPNDPNVSNQYNYGIYGYGQAQSPYAPGGPPPGFAPGQNAMTLQPSADVYPGAPMEDIFAANRNMAATTGDVIGGEAAAQLNYYSPLQQNFQNAQNTALNQLAQTPGYTPQEAGQINVDYSQFNTPAAGYAAITGNPNAPVSQFETNQANTQGTMGAYISGAQTALGNYQSGLNNAVGTGAQNETAALYAGAGNVRGAEGGLSSGIQSAYGAFSPLNAAVYNPALGFDPNATERQLTNQDVSDLTTQAGTTVGNEFRSQLDTLNRQAAAQGNTSPAALAAMRQQLLTQEGSSIGDAMTNARIAALQAQYQRAAGIEAQREGAVQTQAGLRATAATTEEAARQAGATTAGLSNVAAEQQLTGEALQEMNLQAQQGIQAQEALGTAGLQSENQYGQFAVNTDVGQNNALLSAQQLADQQASQRAAQVAGMQYGEGVGSQQLTSQGAQTVGGARIAGQGAYRSGVAQQQGLAQQGGQAAIGQQLGAYGTQTQGLNQAAQSQAGFEVGKSSLGDTAGKALVGLFGEGGIADQPQVAKLAEKGPELVIPIRRGGRYRPAERMAA